MGNRIERTVQVTINLPAQKWWQLAKIADERGIRVADLVAERAVKTPAGRPVRRAGSPTTRDRVADLHAEGMTDPQIARHLNIAIPTARYHRLKLGLDLNRDTP